MSITGDQKRLSTDQRNDYASQGNDQSLLSPVGQGKASQDAWQKLPRRSFSRFLGLLLVW